LLSGLLRGAGRETPPEIPTLSHQHATTPNGRNRRGGYFVLVLFLTSIRIQAYKSGSLGELA
jgi:hypothetical protein